MSQVSRLCAEIDVRVSAFLGRPIEGDWPYLWIVKVREAGRIVSVAAIVAVGVNTHGRREVLGRAGAGLPQSVLGTRCAGSHVPASARPGRRRTSPRLRASSVAQRRSRSSRKRSVSKSSSAILSMVIVVSARCWFRFGNPTLSAIRDDRVARGAPRQTYWRSLGAPRSAPPPVPGHRRSRSSRIATATPRPCSPASCRSAAGTTSSASRLSPMPFSIASCTTPQRIELKGDSLRKRQRAPLMTLAPWVRGDPARRPVSHGEGHAPAA
jgi:hypothetical protein